MRWVDYERKMEEKTLKKTETEGTKKNPLAYP
jgi:hypothetical protein